MAEGIFIASSQTPYRKVISVTANDPFASGAILQIKIIISILTVNSAAEPKHFNIYLCSLRSDQMFTKSTQIYTKITIKNQISQCPSIIEGQYRNTRGQGKLE